MIDTNYGHWAYQNLSSLERGNSNQMMNSTELVDYMQGWWTHLKVGFPAEQDSTTFRDNGTEVSSLSRDKGTTGQAQNLAKGRAGTAKTWDGTGRDSQNPGRDAGQNGTEQKRMF